MQSNRARALIGVGAVAVIVVLFIVLSGGDDNNDSSTNTSTSTQTTTSPSGATGATSETPAAPKTKTIVVVDGKPQGGVQDLEFNNGDRVRFKVRSDVADEIHVHGYDLMKDVEAGSSVSFSFPADIEGVFEIELEGRKEQIAELRVNP